MRSRVFEKVVSSVLTLALTIQPALLHAQNIQPVGPNTGPRPHVDQSLNGTTVINISTPNGAGVSHDVYTDFQADDLILNNSATITNTQLGGVIEGNGNLTPGQEANLWIGEVVGGNQTQLGGILEVAGKRMDVVVANEFGITCNGCGFINTGRATLTTGKPQFAGNGALIGFDVRRGTVTIGAGGLNPENRVGLTDTSRVDVIARAAAIYGKMRADQLNVVAGANQVDYNWSYDPETGAVTGITEQAGEDAAPELAVDVAALGGMYANAIRLIATENGVGVRLNGDMASSTNIALRADGQLTLGAPVGGHTPQIRAGGRVQVRNQGPILLEGAITSESGDLIDIGTSNGDLTFNGQAAGGAIRLESAGMLNISGAIVARNAFAAASTGSSVGLDGNSEVFAQSIDVNALTQLTFDGKAAALEAASLTAGTELVTGADSELVAESVALTGGDTLIEGQVQALEELTIEATDGSVTHTGSSRGQSVTIAGDEVQTSDESQIAAVESLSVTAQDQAIIDGDLVAGQQANLSVTAGDLDLQGQINALNTDVAVSGQTSLGADALLAGQSVLEFQSGSLNGGLNASHFNQLRAGDGLAVTLDSGGLSVGASEQVLFDGDLLLDLGGDIENRGTIKASGDLQLRSGSDLNNLGGLLKSGETMQLVARNGTVLNQSGRIEADGGLAIEAETFDNRFDSIVTQPSQSGVEIFAGTPDNKTATRRVTTNPADLELESCFTSSRSNGGADRASSCATIYSFDGVFSNRGGVTWSTGTSVAASGAKPEILSGAGIAIQADTVRNDAGLISAEGGIDVQSSSFANNGYQDTRVTHTATYTRNLTIEINEGSGGSDAAFTTRTERVTYSPVSRETSNGATSEIGQILAGGSVNISSTSVLANGDIRSGTSNVVAPRDSSAVTSALLPELVVPGSSLTPVQPELQELANLDTLIGEGRTNFGTTPVSYEDFISSDYFLDRLQIQDELFQNINRPAEWNGYPSDGTSYEGGDAVQGPGTGFNGFGDRFGLSDSGLLASLDKANTSETGDLTIVAGRITGSGGSLISENGSLSLTSFGNITFEDTELGGDLVDIITGGDFSGKALVIRSASDTSIFAAGNVVIEGLAQTEEYYTNTSVTKITENLASRFETGGNLSIISSADMTLAGVQAQVTGDTRLTAGGSLYLLAEQSGVQYSEGDAKNGTDRLTLTAQVTQLSTGGDFIANAGGDAVLIGTQIDAGGKAHLAAAGDVVLAAAQDIYQSETRKTSSGFLSKKKETRSTLAVTNRGVGITAGSDIDVIAETGDLTTAGTELASVTGDINLTATEGNILVGTYTDVFEETHVKEKSYLGGLLSKSSQLHTVDHINTGTDALAGLDLSIVSGTDTTLVGATLSAGQNLNITTGGDFSVQAAIDSHRSEFFETDMGLVTMTTITETSFTETAVLTELLAGQGMNFDIGGDAELVLYQSAGVDAPNPQDLYPEELLAIDGLELINQELADEYFYEEKTQLSPAFKALVAIAVAAYVAPTLVGNVLPELAGAAAAEGATALTTGLYNGATAFTSTALVETLDGVVAGDLDLGAILEAATFSGVSAGLTSGINLNIPESSPLNDVLISGLGNPQGPQLTVAGILEGALDGSISSGLSSAVYGTDFADGFSANLVQTVTNLALADAQFEIGGLFTDANGNPINGGEGSAGHVLLHALAGCAAAEASGADCAAGAAGGIAQSIYAGALGDLSPEERAQALANSEVVGALSGFAFSGGEADNVAVAANVARSGFANNYLSHDQWAMLIEEIGDCGGDASCIESELLEYTALSVGQNIELNNCISNGNSGCVSRILNDLRELDSNYAHTVSELVDVLDDAGLNVSDNALVAGLFGLDAGGLYQGQVVSFNPGQYDGTLLGDYQEFATQNCLPGSDCLRTFAQHRQEEFEAGATALMVTGVAPIIVGAAIIAGPEVVSAVAACSSNPVCLSNLSVAVGEASLGVTGATAGQTFFAVGGATAVVGGRLVLQHGDQIIAVFDDAGNIFKPVSQTVDDSGRFLVTNTDGAVGYLDNGSQFVPSATNNVGTPIKQYPDGSFRTADGKFASQGGLPAPGTKSAQEYTQFLRDKGFDVVGEELTVKGAVGNRRYDAVVRTDSGELWGVEYKSGSATKTPQQNFNDIYVNQFGADGVGQLAGEKVVGNITIYLP
jgi:filamentous hemagglutinin family protein